MSSFRIFVIEYERIWRQRLRRLLALEPGCELLGESAMVAEAAAAISGVHPDILFLSVQTAEREGPHCLQTISRPLPLIICTTTRPDSRFEHSGISPFGYLVKPFNARCFRELLEHAKAQLARDRFAAGECRLVELLENLARGHHAPRRIAVRSGGRIVFVRLEEINWIEASDNYVCLHCGRDKHFLRETMNAIEKRLDPSQFLRVHRSAIVNLDCIKELQAWFHGDHRVILRDGTELTLTKSHRAKLASRLALSMAGR